MKSKYLLCLIQAVILSGLVGRSPLRAQESEQPGCKGLSPDLVTKLTRFTQLRFRLQTTPDLEVIEKRPDCYYKVALVAVEGGKPYRKTVYISPDRKHLSSELVDIDGDPDVTVRNDEARTKAIVKAEAQVIYGSEHAPVQLVVYADFECPYCARFWTKVLRPYLSTNDPALAVLYRSYPLERQHPWARVASLVSKCAELQGQSYFMGLADKIYANQPLLNLDNVVGVASSYLQSQAKFDIGRFKSCLSGGQVEGALQADIESGQQVGLRAIPTVFINGARFRGAPTAEQLAAMLDDAKKRAHGEIAPAPATETGDISRDNEQNVLQAGCTRRAANQQCEKQ